MALGARRAGVLRMILGQALLLCSVGIAVGLLAAAGLTRLMATMLFEVEAIDPVTFGAVSVLLAIVAAVAGYLPAYRATRIDPLIALRHE